MIGLSITCIAMFIVMGGHFAVVQGVAWTQMILDYSQSTGSIKQAVSDTFDGKHPCKMCKRIVDAGKEQGAKKHSLRNADKREIVCTEVDFRISTAPAWRKFSYCPAAELIFTVRTEAPEAPIPIAS